MKRLLGISLAILLFTAGCSVEKDKISLPAKAEEKIEYGKNLNIMTTNKLLYNMVEDIVKDKHNVDYMFKEEADQWNFQFTSDSTTNISNKDLFVYLGAQNEPWIDNFVDKLDKGKVSILDSSRGIKSSTLSTPKFYNNKQFQENPYFWLNTDYYKIALSNIKNSIEEKDPGNRSFYEDNFNQCLVDIDNCKKSKKDILSKSKDYTFFAVNDDLDYFTNELGLNVIKVNTFSNKDALEAKLNDVQNSEGQVVFLYSESDQQIEINNMTQKYNVKNVLLLPYSADLSYIDLIKKNYESLGSIIKS